MAINPELITTIRVDQLPDGTLNLTNKIPHTSGTVLEKASVQELVDLVATAIGVSGGVGYIALSVTDGQQLPDVPELPSFFLCGAGTFLNINGYPNIICTENLNAIMSLTDHWELAVEIPINPLSGTVQSVTGSAVDNTDPLNPVINEIISGVQNIIAGTNITVDNTDPANPIVSATGGAGTPTLQQVLVEGNETNGEDIFINDGDSILFENGSLLKEGTYDFGADGGISRICGVGFEDMWQSGIRHVFDSNGLIRNSTNCFDIIPDNTFDNTLRFKVDSLWTLDDGKTYKCTDASTGAAVWELWSIGSIPTLQEILDNNHDLVNSNNFQGTGAGIDNTGAQVNAFGFNASRENTGNSINALGINTCYQNTGDAVNALGDTAAQANTGTFVNALGQDAANANTGNQVNALGTEAAIENAGGSVNAFGNAAAGFNTGNNVNALGDNAGYNNTFNNVNLFGNAATADEDGQTVISKNGSIFARISTTDLTATHKYNLPDTDGTLALTSDITTPTLQQVTDVGNETSNPIKVIDSGNASTQLQQNGIVFEDLDDLGSTCLLFQQNSEPIQQVVEVRPLGGTMALLSDIPTGGGGIPHATASGTDTYTATITGVTAYNDADAYLIRFTNGNTTSATLNINSLGAVPLYRNNDGPLLGGDVLANGEMLCIYNSTTNIFQVIGISPNSLIAYVTNDDSVTITKGMPVYAFSGQGDRMTVKRANNSSDATSAQTVGLVLSTSIAAGQKGVIMMQGLLDDLSTLPTATFADGDPIYVGSTDGSITNVKPYAPNHLVYLGVVTTASNGSAGRMYVRVQNGYELSEIHDIDLISNAPTNNQALTYETSTQLWKNKTIIEDSITDGVTDKAPSQNAVFDALALRQRKLFNLTSQVTHTGTTAKTIIATYFIPANTFTNGDFLNFSAMVTKVANIANTTHTLEINTTNTLTGATIISTAGLNTTNFSMKFKREIALNGGNGYILNINAATTNDQTIGIIPNAMSTFTYNLAADLYFFVTCTLQNATDSITYRGIKITD